MKADLDDLATLERVAERAQTRDGWAAVPAHKVLALVAELRAAREVIEAVRPYMWGSAPKQPDASRPLATAMAAYDQAVAS